MDWKEFVDRGVKVVKGAGRAAASVIGGIGEAKRLGDQLGRLEDAVTVKVSGTPLARKADLYWLAAAIGFGMVVRMRAGMVDALTLPPTMLAIDYDPTSKEVTFHLRYSQSILTLTSFSRANTTAISGSPVFTGPPDTVVGGAWDFVPRVILGTIALPTAVGAPPGVLPFTGRVVLTDASATFDPVPVGATPAVTSPQSVGATPITVTPNPRPLGDARSRGSLCWLVYQSLASPSGTGPSTYDRPTNANRFTGG